MKLLLGALTLGAGLLAHMAPAMASVPIICAPGLPPVQSAGVQISGATVEILDDACRPPPSGGSLPPLLTFANAAVTPTPAQPGAQVTYTVNLQNLISQPVPGVTEDRCNIELRQPSGAVSSSTQVTSLTASLSIPVTIPSMAASGVWQVGLTCQRWVSGQQIVVPSAASTATVQVNSTTVPSSCDSMTPPFRAGTVSTYGGAIGVPFGMPHDWHHDVTGNTFNPNQTLQWANVRVYTVVAPDPGNLPAGVMANGTLRSDVAMAGSVVTLSAQCGNINVPRECRMVSSDFIRWSTTGIEGRCQLTPNQTYYVNVAWIDLPTYLANPSNPASVVSTCPLVAGCGFGFRATN